MKSKIVLWGENASNEKILVALELIAEENKVKITTIPKESVTDEFYDTLRDKWRTNKEEVVFPEGHKEQMQDLTVSETLLPDDIKVDRTDLIERKKLEWHVMVLSSKMHKQFKGELQDLKEKIDQLDTFDKGIWENLKGFWGKVQTQIREGILTRNYSDDLRKGSDELFDKMKVLRKKLDEEYREKAKENFDWFSGKLDAVEKKIEEGLKISGVFDELKDLQKKFRNTQLTREFKDKIWSRIDGSFKAAKEKRYGANATNDNSAIGRLNRRYEGLLKAIKRTEHSKERDVKDLEFENRRIQNTDGQLEAQIRQAKIKMIEQRLKFKNEKLEDMYKTKKELDAKMEKLKEREHVEKLKKEKAAAVKEKIKNEAKAVAENMDDATKEKLESAANKINESKKKKPKTLVDKIVDTASEVKDLVGDKLEDMVDTAKAAAVVVGDEVSEKMEPYTKKGEEIVENLKNKVEDVKDAMEEKIKDVTEIDDDASEVVVLSSSTEDIDNITNESDMGKDDKGFFDKLKDKAKDIAENLEEKMDKAVDAVEDKLDNAVDAVENKLETEENKDKGFFGKLSDKAGELKDVVEEKMDKAVDTVESKLETEENKDKGFFGKLMDKAGDVTDAVGDKVNSALEVVEDKMDNIVDGAEEKLDDIVDGTKKAADDVADDVKNA